MPVQINFPSSSSLSKGAGVNLAFKFGMSKGTPFKVSGAIGSEGNPKFGIIEELLGQPKITSLALKYGSKELILEECVLTVSQEKNIITTPLQGRDGTVKEFISKGDYNISADLAVSNYNKSESEDSSDESSFQYPRELLEKLVKLLNVDDTIIVDSDFLTVFGVKSVVVQSYNLQQETHSNRQSLQIQMLSDEPYEIKIGKTQNA
ncbi:DUF6046 domain-containing protein [Tenacibaculum maritimum]|nr:DUF6046 domain-containing protein [Tenacibaculum maritimum]MDB0611248.1 DUF6046 domain-containing protein [Tenacibaculum maritimum]